MLTRFFITFFFSFVLLIPMAIGQETVLSDEDREIMTRDVMAAYPDQFQTVKINSMTRIDENYLRMAYRSTSGHWEAVLQVDDTNLTLVETGQVIPQTEWPEIIVDAMKEKGYAPYQIEKILKVSSPYGEQGYRADVKSEKQDAAPLIRHYFDRLGQYEKPIF